MGFFAETIFETGTNSVGYYETEEELLDALKVHHKRATTGGNGGPEGTNHKAERITKVELYDKHPSELNELQVVGTDVAKSELAAILKDLDDGGSVSVTELAARIRAISSPLVDNPKAHESMYKMPATKVLKSGWES